MRNEIELDGKAVDAARKAFADRLDGPYPVTPRILFEVAIRAYLTVAAASKGGCLLCAHGNDLPDGETCQACGLRK